MNEGWKNDYYGHIEKLTLLRIKRLNLAYLSFLWLSWGRRDWTQVIDRSVVQTAFEVLSWHDSEPCALSS